jgi:serine/threonine protein phosphatase PrpC
MNATLRDWPLSNGATFSAGNSVFRASEVDKTPGIMLLEVLAGPLKGETYCVSKEGATLGRATDNTINIADRELSRRHSKIEWVPSQKEPNGVVVSGGGFYLTDIGSTNGTYVQLVGPYSSSRRLRLSDHILVGRTGFSVNRYDWGIWEDRGVRKTMEDKSIVIQDMCVRALSEVGLFPQTFFAVYDGHGGAEASSFLWQNLHVNLSEAFEQAAQQLKAAHDLEMSQASAGDTGDPMMMCSSSPPAESVDDVIRRVVSKCFLDSDKHFLATSERPQCGSTATTVLIAGDRFYSFNVGDSRTILCRRSQNHLISADHKPSREDELQRIRDAGGLVINKRVMGELAVSRAFGDKEFKLGIKVGGI